MVATKNEDLTKQGFCKNTLKKTPSSLWEGLLLSLIGVCVGGSGVGVGAYLLFEAGRLLTFSAFRMGAYSRWALIRGWVLIRMNTVNEQH